MNYINKDITVLTIFPAQILRTTMLLTTNLSNCASVVSLIMDLADDEFPRKLEELPLSDQVSIKESDEKLRNFLRRKKISSAGSFD